MAFYPSFVKVDCSDTSHLPSSVTVKTGIKGKRQKLPTNY